LLETAKTIIQVFLPVPSKQADTSVCNVKKILLLLWNVNPKNALHKNKITFQLDVIETFCPAVINGTCIF